jgi:hypothetical protein
LNWGIINTQWCTLIIKYVVRWFWQMPAACSHTPIKIGNISITPEISLRSLFSHFPHSSPSGNHCFNFYSRWLLHTFSLLSGDDLVSYFHWAVESSKKCPLLFHLLMHTSCLYLLPKAEPSHQRLHTSQSFIFLLFNFLHTTRPIPIYTYFCALMRIPRTLRNSLEVNEEQLYSVNEEHWRELSLAVQSHKADALYRAGKSVSAGCQLNWMCWTVASSQVVVT